MTMSISLLMPTQIIKCISAGRLPTQQELFEVAEQMWIDGAAGRSAFSWDRLLPNSSDRLIALRSAQLALSGDTMISRCDADRI
jgi:hypothetical protein